MKALVVDDEGLIRMAVRTILEDRGAEVLEARNGSIALALLQEHPDIGLLFTDIVMPGMSGIELAQFARALRPALKIVLTTGYSQLEPSDEFPIIRKPWNIEQIEALLTEEPSAH